MKTSIRTALMHSILTCALSLGALACVASPVASRAPADAGGSDRGGGEPGAIEFINLANKLANWLELHPSRELTASAVRASAQDLWNHLNSDESEQLLVFTDHDVNCHIGESYINKLACTDHGLVTVNRGGWNAISTQQKIEVVALEIGKLNGLGERYSLAAAIGQHSRQIESLTEKTILPLGATKNDATELQSVNADVFAVIKKDIHIAPDEDEIWFYKNQVRTSRTLDQIDYENTKESLKLDWMMKKFGPAIGKYAEHDQPMCFIKLFRTTGGVLRQGRVFRVDKPDDFSGRTVYIEHLGSLHCGNQPGGKMSTAALKDILGQIIDFKFDFKKASSRTSTEQDY